MVCSYCGVAGLYREHSVGTLTRRWRGAVLDNHMTQSGRVRRREVTGVDFLIFMECACPAEMQLFSNVTCRNNDPVLLRAHECHVEVVEKLQKRGELDRAPIFRGCLSDRRI